MKFTKNISQRKRFQKLAEKALLKGARVIDPGNNPDKECDILIENGIIQAVEKINESGFDGDVFDFSGKIISPGWMDMHVHLREPGREDEETILSGSLAAANGGFTAICCMPDTLPAIDSQEIVLYIKDRTRDSLVAVHPIAAMTKKREGKELAEILDLVEQGAVAISDADAPVMSSEIMRNALAYSKMVDIPVIAYEEDKSMTHDCYMNEGYVSTCLGLGGIPAVAEEVMIARDIMLAEYGGGRLHIAHISTEKGVDLVRQAKKRGVRVTAEVTPHHFTLTDDAVRSFNTNTKIKPPLRTPRDVEALLEGLKDGTIDVIASDHSPHSWEEKAAEFIYAPFGITGLETSLGLCLDQLVKTNVLSIASLIEKTVTNPYKILGLTPPAIRKNEVANLTVFDTNVNWQLSVDKLLSKSANTPFSDKKFTTKPVAVFNNNQYFFSVL